MALVRQFRPDGSSYVVISETSASNAITPGSNNASQTPDAESCLAHLRLLEAFFRLREEISQRDGLFGLRDSFAGSTVDEERNHTLARIREKRWVIYVTKAAIRFEKWWDHCVQKGRPEHGHNMIAKTPPRQFSVDNIPPLDIILVWHAFQLSPRPFFEDCFQFGLVDIWKAGLPWQAISSCINDSTFRYKGTETAVKAFEAATSICWESSDDPISKAVKCPRCETKRRVPLTRWDCAEAWERQGLGFRGEETANGYSDLDFHLECHCGFRMTHDNLRTHKFRQDLLSLEHRGSPMQGTYLDEDGRYKLSIIRETKPSFFPNRLLKGIKPRTRILSMTDPLKDEGHSTCMADIRNEIELALTDAAYVRSVNLNTSPSAEERMAVQRMISCYWENSSEFAIDLVGAVIRQGTFMQAMHDLDWLHSPAAKVTMNRFIRKYLRFIDLIADCPRKDTVVPTLDVDLVWHTHQLSPLTYYLHSTRKLSRLLNHDNMDETVLNDGFQWMCRAFQKRYDELYSECTCWYCEATRESFTGQQRHRTSLKDKFRRKSKGVQSQLDRLYAATDVQMPHVSAHGAVQSNALEMRATAEHAGKIRLEFEYHKAVDRAREEGRNPPERGEYREYLHFGIPLTAPAKMPFESDVRISRGLYAADPIRAAFVTGGVDRRSSIAS